MSQLFNVRTRKVIVVKIPIDPRREQSPKQTAGVLVELIRDGVLQNERVNDAVACVGYRGGGEKMPAIGCGMLYRRHIVWAARSLKAKRDQVSTKNGRVTILRRNKLTESFLVAIPLLLLEMNC